VVDRQPPGTGKRNEMAPNITLAGVGSQALPLVFRSVSVTSRICFVLPELRSV
jgi:hypothetical protein